MSHYVIILNYNSWKDTLECLEAVMNSSFTDLHIIVLDNKSTNSSDNRIKAFLNGEIQAQINQKFYSSKLKKRHLKLPHILFDLTKPFNAQDVVNKELLEESGLKHPITYIQTGKNLGFGAGNNVALKRIVEDKEIHKTSRILLLNPDTFISKNAIEELNKVNKDYFICGCKIKDYINYNSTTFLGAYKLFKPFALLRPIKNMKPKMNIDYVYGGALYTNKNTFIKNGIFPEDYFLYWEETEWCYKAKLSGAELIICQEAIVYDKVGTSVGRGYLAHYYYIRNGLIFYKKYLKQYLPSLIMFHIFRALNKVRKGEVKNAKAIVDGTRDFFKGKKGDTIAR